MKRENISRILNGIDPAFVEECVMQPSERNRMKHSTRRLVVLIAAACLLLTLAITAYATGAFRSILADFWGSYGPNLTTPEEERAKGRDDYADWLEEELQMKENMLNIAEKTTPENTFIPIKPGSKAGVTVLESYYDGEKIALGCQFHRIEEEKHLSFDVDLTKPELAAIETWQTLEDPEYYLNYIYKTTESEQQEITDWLKKDGTVYFMIYDSWLRDHVYANDEDLGPCHGDVDENGYFTVDPVIMGMGEIDLPEACQNLPEIAVTLNYAVGRVVYRLEGDTLQYASLQNLFYPICFTVTNQNG